MISRFPSTVFCRKMNPHSENSLALTFFEPVTIENGNSNSFKCKLCAKERNGTKKANLVSHLKNMHYAVYSAKVRKKIDSTSMKLELDRVKLLQHFVELTTINKQPFTTLLMSGFQKIVADRLKELQDGGCGIILGRSLKSVKDHIRKTAARIREIIASEIKDRMITMSADIVTKNNRSIFGIYIQYILNGKLIIRCIGMKQLHDRHTGKYLSELLDDCVRGYGANLNNIISLTTDNGSNMRTLLSSINTAIDDETEEAASVTLNDVDHLDISHYTQIDELGEQHEEATASNSIDQTDDIEIEHLMNRLVPSEAEWSFGDHLSEVNWSMMHSLALVNGVNCAAHTIQLAIKNALFQLGSQQADVIKLCRDVCKFIRHQKTIYAMEKRGLKKKFPALDVDTRWSSTYLMVHSTVFPVIHLSTDAFLSMCLQE